MKTVAMVHVRYSWIKLSRLTCESILKRQLNPLHCVSVHVVKLKLNMRKKQRTSSLLCLVEKMLVKTKSTKVFTLNSAVFMLFSTFGSAGLHSFIVLSATGSYVLEILSMNHSLLFVVFVVHLALEKDRYTPDTTGYPGPKLGTKWETWSGLEFPIFYFICMDTTSIDAFCKIKTRFMVTAVACFKTASKLVWTSLMLRSCSKVNGFGRMNWVIDK